MNPPMPIFVLRANYPQLASDSAGLRTRSHKTALTAEAGCKCRVSRTPKFCLTWLQIQRLLYLTPTSPALTIH